MGHKNSTPAFPAGKETDLPPPYDSHQFSYLSDEGTSGEEHLSSLDFVTSSTPLRRHVPIQARELVSREIDHSHNSLNRDDKQKGNDTILFFCSSQSVDVDRESDINGAAKTLSSDTPIVFYYLLARLLVVGFFRYIFSLNT